MILTQQVAKTQNENIELKIDLERINYEKTKIENDFKIRMAVLLLFIVTIYSILA